MLRRRKKSSFAAPSPRSASLLLSPEQESSIALAEHRYQVHNSIGKKGGKHGTVLFASRTPGKEFAIKVDFSDTVPRTALSFPLETTY